MFMVVSEFTVAADNAEAFEAGFAASMQDTLVDVPGLRRSLLRPTNSGRAYMALMEFEDETAYQTYLSSPAFHQSHSAERKSIATGFSSGEFESVLELLD
ncbi:antibiotic biosynthesis monooxygenase family protein [Microbacterium sp. 22242]|uniref:antibiotic biosynthesis monooxygenase family protein n=1 Tax=Microbacterium sp. 22242 TaxID=3453896 RepID=UPI003F863B92